MNQGSFHSEHPCRRPMEQRGTGLWGEHWDETTALGTAWPDECYSWRSHGQGLLLLEHIATSPSQPGLLNAFPRYAPHGMDGRQLLSGTTSMTQVLSGPVMVGFAVGSRTLACGHSVWEAEPQTDMPWCSSVSVTSCRGCPQFSAANPFSARRQSLSQEE